MAELASAMQTLAHYRIHCTRNSQDTVTKGLYILKNKGMANLTDESWAFLEQLTLAAIDTGRLDVAEKCLKTLENKFPGSPRVAVLKGIYVEATLPAEAALRHYEDMLDADESNGAVWKRQISVLRRMGKVDRAVEQLSHYLDTYYTDVEGWVELADLYASVHQYTHALQSLSHALILAPQNPFYVLQAAETAYSAGDVPLALKFFLGAADMSGTPDLEDAPTPSDSIPTGASVRVWYGTKRCAQRLLKDNRASVSASQTSPPETKHLQLLDELATERLLTAYSAGRAGRAVQGREALVKWLEMT